MFSPKIIVLDCRIRDVTAAVFRRTRGRLQPIRAARETLPAPFENNERWLEKMRVALPALRRRLKASGPTTVILPAHWVLLKFVGVPSVPATEREKIIRFEAEQVMPIPLAELVWGWMEAGEHEQTGQLMLAAAKLDLLLALGVAVSGAGFDVDRMVPAVVATLAGFHLVHTDEKGSALIIRTDHDGVGLIQKTGNHFVAREIRFANGPDRRGDTAAEANTGNGFVEKTTELADEILRSELFFQRQHHLPVAERIYLCGAEDYLTGLAQDATTTRSRPVVPIKFHAVIDCVAVASPELELVSFEQVGAAANQLIGNDSSLTLLPTVMQTQVRRRQQRPWLVAAGLLLSTAMLPLTWHFSRLTEVASRKTAAIERELVPLRPLAAQLKADSAELETIRQQIAIRREICVRRTAWLEMFADFETKAALVNGAWIEQVGISAGTGTEFKLVVSGQLEPGSVGGEIGQNETRDRFRELMTRLSESSFVSAIENERIEMGESGSARFTCAVVLKPERPL